jgi:hypothetical protein
MRFTLLAATAASLLAVLPAAALDLPARKPGLWEIKMIMEGRAVPPQSSQQCIDAAMDKEMNALGSNFAKDKCSRQDVNRAGDTIVVDSDCQISGVKSSTHAEITGAFDSAYTVKLTSKMDGAMVPGMPAAALSTRMTIEAKWLGACKADQKPGDIVLGNGTKMNVRDAQKLGGHAPGQAR